MSKIKDTNNTPKLLKNLKQAANTKVEVGVFGKQIALIVGVNEFGANIKVTKKMRGYLGALGLHLKKSTNKIKIPERSSLRSSFDNKKNIDQVFKFAQNVYDFNKDVNASMNALGVKMSAIIKKKISSNIPPSNHPFTIQQKGGKNKTLINRGVLLNSIRHELK